MLSFSEEDVIFQYIQKEHLKTTIQLTNHSDVLVYYKFKVTKPQFYLVKDDKGAIQSGQKKQVSITLHKNGISESADHKFKCFYAFTNAPEEDMINFERDSSTQHRRLQVKIQNLPFGLASKIEGKNSVVNSLGTPSKFMSKTRNSMTLEGTVRERESRLETLREDISNIRKSLADTTNPKKKQSSGVGILPLVIVGLAIGVVSSFWI